ncbi:MAG: nucleoside hydrolase, partial [Betaproteobacteria bacterium]
MPLRRLALLGACFLALSCGLAQAAPRRQVIVDQDMFGPGGSNMNSVLMLLQAPDVEVLGIVVSSGDGWRDDEIAQTLRMLELVHRTDVPVYAGAVYPLLNSSARMKAWEQRFGPLVWKGAWTETFGGQPRAAYHADPFAVPPSPAGAPALKVQAESGVDFMIRAVRRAPGQVTLWIGGALTDVALAARQDPGFAAAARELVFMGGSFNPVAASNEFADEYRHSPRREFNMLWDAEAASAVLHEAWPRVVQLPVDPTTKTFVWKVSGFNGDWFASPYDAQPLPGGRLAVANARQETGRVTVYDTATGAQVWKYSITFARLVEMVPAGSGTGTTQPTLLMSGRDRLTEAVYAPGAVDNGLSTWQWAAGSNTHRAILDRDGHSVVVSDWNNLVKVSRPTQDLAWSRPQGNTSGEEMRGIAMTAAGYVYGYRVWYG